jgi:diguanylate cyclase (GGDEF)-like protein
MKVTGARSEPFSAIRKRALLQAGGQLQPAAGAKQGVDQAAFLGLTEADLTAPVQAALKTLLTEIDDLRGEVKRLKLKLEEVEGLADRDVLTPLLNRRAFMRELARVQAFAQRYGSGPASLIYFDLDDLKGVNDRFGHAAGDLALKQVAEALARSVRESDLVGRLAGDEFGIVLVQADAALAEAKGRALVLAIESTPVDLGEWSAPLRISYGVREIDLTAAPETLLAAADQAMYANKRARREAAATG